MAAFLSVGKVAEMFDVDPDTVRNWCEEGRIEYIITPGGHRRISQESIDKFRYPADDLKDTIASAQIQLADLKRQVADEKIKKIQRKIANEEKRLAKLRFTNQGGKGPDKGAKIRDMLKEGCSYSEIEVALSVAPNRISRVSKAMKMEVKA